MLPHPSLKNIAPLRQLASPPRNRPRFFSVLNDREGQTFYLADPKATRALIACMDMEAVLGGAASHWGGPAGFAEIMSSLHALMFDWAEKKAKSWFELFHLINDAGHCENGIYALKANYAMAGLSIEDLKKFRSIESHLTGHGEAHLFPEGVYLSNGPLGSTLGQAQGLAMADKLIGNNRMTISTLSDGACMEGEAKEALSAIPGFAKKGRLNPFLLVISDNNTKLTGRIDEDSFSMAPFFKSLKILGWQCSYIPEGNCLKSVFSACQEGFKNAWNEPTKPVALIFKTLKGFGVKKTVEDPAGGHGFPLKNPEELEDFIKEIYGSDKPPKEIMSWARKLQNSTEKAKARQAPSLKKAQAGIAKALIEQKQQGVPLISISSDLPGSTGLSPFRKQFPESSFDVGVAEANMISAAAGFSKQGFVPVVDSFAQFAVTKGGLPLIMSALSQAPVIGVFSHAGFQDAADGASHQALSYFAKTCALPHTDVYALSCCEEAYHLISQAVQFFYQEKKAGRVPKNQIFFLGREMLPESLTASSSLDKTERPTKAGGKLSDFYRLDKAQLLFDNSRGPAPVLIVTCGPLAALALKSAQKLKEKGRGVVLLNSPCVSNPDVKSVSKWLSLCGGRLVTAEDHQIKGGMASILVLALKEAGASISQLKCLGVRGGFGRSAYKSKDLYKLFGLDESALEKAVISMS